jgi:hypothetical protein
VTYYPDLSPYEYLPGQPEMINIGWLAAGHAFEVGPVPAVVLKQLLVLADDQANVTRGIHRCDFCDVDDMVSMEAPVEGGLVHLGMGELHVRSAEGLTYSAPSLIVHYISAHGYQPPSEFQQAIMYQSVN